MYIDLYMMLGKIHYMTKISFSKI